MVGRTKKSKSGSSQSNYPLDLDIIYSRRKALGKGDFEVFLDPMSFIVTFLIIMSTITISIFCIFSGSLSRNDTTGNLLGNFGDVATSILLVGSALVAVLAYKL